MNVSPLEKLRLLNTKFRLLTLQQIKPVNHLSHVTQEQFAFDYTAIHHLTTSGHYHVGDGRSEYSRIGISQINSPRLHKDPSSQVHMGSGSFITPPIIAIISGN
jgi:hypothetical protein